MPDTPMLLEAGLLLEAENATQRYRWRSARVELGPRSGTLTIIGDPDGEPAITLSAVDFACCEIVEREGISLLADTPIGLLGSDLGDAGCLIALLLAPVAFVETIVADQARVPVIKLTQSVGGEAGQTWVIHLRSRYRGRRGRMATREVAQRIGAFLGREGYTGPMPDLKGNVWRLG